MGSGPHFHSLRHLFASQLLAVGVDLPTVSGLLGHANVAVTARVYAHQLPGRGGWLVRRLLGLGDLWGIPPRPWGGICLVVTGPIRR